MFSFICHSQTDTIKGKSISTTLLNRNNFYLFNAQENNSKLALNFSFNQQNNKSRFTLYNYSMLYDNYRHEYFYNNPLQPYKNFKTAVAAGTLNYLFLLFDKKK